MSWRIHIGLCLPWADACWFVEKDKGRAKEIIEKYAWQRPLKVAYLKGCEDMLLYFAELLEEEGVLYEEVWATYQDSIETDNVKTNDVKIKVKVIGEHITLEELKKRLGEVD